MDFLATICIQALHLLFSGEPDTMAAIRATLRSSFAALAAAFMLGAPCGFFLGYAHFPGKRMLRLLVETSLSIPTVVIGLVVYGLLTRRGPLGEWGLLFTVPGMSLGLTLLAFPLVVAHVASGVAALDQRLRPTLWTLGASPWRACWTTLHEARHAVFCALATAFGRVVSEVGIAMMVGGNIKGVTRTMTTAIALETNKGEFAQGFALGLVLLGIALATNLALSLVRRRMGGAE
ncbi:ABC transporter permease [Thermodesulfomicrobium sp. WS]|jgi:tungstate transport system permease protein|uniref:ABC transporter permease n=1 Tax=Thermodesulfomicrobium sp. WS TaxID=3004129 RepID=UPI0024933351|nr:ABC transporter permease [Thermodesulfomicrobium sp. WS]BDU99992.1 ABC transporter permease [Thermodesulfomicrobium sp. WS]